MATATITTSNAAYRKNYEPMMPSVYFAEYPYLFRTPYKMEDGKCPKEYFTQFDEIFKMCIRDRTDLFPMLGETALLEVQRKLSWDMCMPKTII